MSILLIRPLERLLTDVQRDSAEPVAVGAKLLHCILDELKDARAAMAGQPVLPREAALTEAYAEGRKDEAGELASVLPGTYYMDPPDGGSVEVLEQLQRMAKDAARYRLVRRGQHWSVINGIGDTLSGAALDVATDAKLDAVVPNDEEIWVEGPVNPGEARLRYRCRKPGESLEHYRIAMGWDKQSGFAVAGWQPIKTAPKDGTHILVWTDASDTAYVVCWADAAKGIRKYLTAESGAERGWHLALDGELFDREHEPTHWMPLPDAPTSQEEQDLDAWECPDCGCAGRRTAYHKVTHQLGHDVLPFWETCETCDGVGYCGPEAALLKQQRSKS